MKINATEEQMYSASSELFGRYGGNVYLERTSSGNYRLRVLSSSGPGSRKTPEGRRASTACWHAFGHFFDALGDATIVVPGYRGPAKDHGWRDRNIGSQVCPFWYSEACDCEEES